MKNFHINICYEYETGSTASRQGEWVRWKEESAMWLSTIPFIAMIASSFVCHTLTDIHLTLTAIWYFFSSLSLSLPPCACYQLRFSLCCAHIEKWMYLTAKLSFQLFNKQRIQLKVKEWLHRKCTVRGVEFDFTSFSLNYNFYWIFHSFRSHCNSQ